MKNKQILLPKKQIQGEVKLPSSKSFSQRAIALASLSDEKTILHNVGNNADVLAAQEIIQQLGAKIDKKQDTIVLQKGISKDFSAKNSINCNESGLSSRLFSCFSLLYTNDFIVNGEGSLQSRSMEMVIEGLEKFGKKVESNDFKLPLKISQEINTSTITIDASISSQFLTGLLIVTPFLPFDTTINVTNLKSIPYVEMTLELLETFGLEYIHQDYATFKIPGNQKINQQIEYKVEGDWSSASFPIVAGAIGGKIKCIGLNPNSSQGDKDILKVIKDCGGKITWEEGNLLIEKGELTPFYYDATDTPDLFPPLAVLASYCGGISKIKGVNRLTHKESNRAEALILECEKVGVKIEVKDDEMWIYGDTQFKVTQKPIFDSHNDHRIAMAMSLYSIYAEAEIEIQDANSIQKSYPDFYEDFYVM